MEPDTEETKKVVHRTFRRWPSAMGTMIGSKCTICGKQYRFHKGSALACPAGKRRNGEYTEVHQFNTFQAKPAKPRSSRLSPVAKRGGSEKRKDRSVRRSVKAEPCWCGKEPGDEYNPVDPAHIRSWKVSQCDEPWNLVSQCRRHHRLQEQYGWLYMSQAYTAVANALRERGWEFLFGTGGLGDWSMFNEKEVELNRKRRAV